MTSHSFVTSCCTGQHRPAARVLVVEDHRDAAESLCLLLEICGYEVSVAFTGPEGVARALTWRPDAVLCDVGLPGLDGYGVARTLRRHQVTAHALLVAVTGYGSDADRQRAREAGFDYHVTKPADPELLEAILERWVEARSSDL